MSRPAYVITTCGKTKSPGPAPAGLFYSGGFVKIQGRVAAALRPRGGRLVLSNKYGFMHPDYVIPGPYDSHWGYPDTLDDESLREQIRGLDLRPGDYVVNTGAFEYARQTRRLFPEHVRVVWLPKTLPDKRMGYQSDLYGKVIRWGRLPESLIERSIVSLDEV